jgi:predicted aconitase with swiveling domain
LIVVTTFKGRRVVGGRARGEALVCKAPLSLRTGIDVKTGRVTEAGHRFTE